METGITRLFQIWIFPDWRGEQPSWGAKPFPKNDRSGKFVILASGIVGDDDALPIRTNARVLGATLVAGQTLEYPFSSQHRYSYLVPATGKINVNGVAVEAHDGVAIKDEIVIQITASEDAELILVNVAG